MLQEQERTRLPWDYGRCDGKDCDRRAKCLRHAALADMGPRTPIYEHMCDPETDWYLPLAGRR